jgi:ribosomal protein S14/phosphatidylserine/phosphatidylglycerophosphate/cardiolipin synthase-like enzyme
VTVVVEGVRPRYNALSVTQIGVSGGIFVAQFLTTAGTSHHLEEIIRNAKAKLVLVSPYLQISEKLIERLQDASKRRVKITLVYGKDELKTEERQKLDSVPSLSLRYYENLHAKCYYSETQLLITSMNMYEFSETKNREMGVLVEKDEDSLIYGKAVAEVESILEHSELKSKPSGLAGVGRAILDVVNVLADDVAGAPSDRYYCIGYGQQSDRDRPYCTKCFAKWARHKNPAQKEAYCHRCGKPDRVSKDYPLCRACYQKLK